MPTSPELHVAARPSIEHALERYSVEPKTGVLLPVHGVGFLESRYGTGWTGAGRGSRNWGAIQSGRPPCAPETSFEYRDSSPNPDGTSTPYRICFRRYRTEEEAAVDLVRVMYIRRPSVLEAAKRADYYGVSSELHATRYYEGFGRTVAERIRRHHVALMVGINGARIALGDPDYEVPTPREPEPWKLEDDVLEDNPLIMRGSRGSLVRDWQRICNLRDHPERLVVDGAFGPATDRVTRMWQTHYLLLTDGKVGPLTWAKAEQVLP